MNHLPYFSTYGEEYLLVCACSGGGSGGESEGIIKIVKVCRYKVNITYHACCVSGCNVLLRC